MSGLHQADSVTAGSQLEEIARGISVLAEAPWYEPIITPGAIIFSGIIGFTAAYLADYWQRGREKRRMNDQATLVRHTLRDEIAHRWNERLGRHLRERIEQNFSIDSAFKLCRFRLSVDDLFITKKVASGFHAYQFLEPGFVSRVVHGHVLLRDLIDNQTSLISECDEYWQFIDRRTLELRQDAYYSQEAALATAENEALERYQQGLEDRWLKLQLKFWELDERLTSLLKEVSADARETGDS